MSHLIDPADLLGKRTARAYREIKRRIIDLDLAPGTVFTEGELAADLELSKTPVREALARLQVESLVEVVGRAGYRVVPITVKAAKELFGLRALLEPEAAALTAAKAAANAIARADLARLKKLAKSGSNTEFHLALAYAAGNEKLADVLGNVHHQLDRLFRLCRIPATAADRAQHLELLDAIAAGDADRARIIARAHLDASHALVLDALLASDSIATAEVTAP